jgi:hypothetical protein
VDAPDRARRRSVVIALVLGLAWGVLAAIPLARRARCVEVHARLDIGSTRSSDPPKVVRALRHLNQRLRVQCFGPLGRVVGAFIARRNATQRTDRIVGELPVAVDLLAVAVGAGCTPYLAVEVAARWSPPTLAATLDDVRRACALGSSFSAALGDAAAGDPVCRPLVDALLASDRYGAPVADALARLATEQRAGVRRRAEARARTVPVRLLFPLVFLVLPAFGLLTVVPSLLAGFRRL